MPARHCVPVSIPWQTPLRLSLIHILFKSGYVKNKVMEFVGPGVASLRQDTRNAIDAMTTEIYTGEDTLSLHDALPI